MKTVTFFETLNELKELTGLSREALWDAGFDLDDWDFGFVSDTEWTDSWGCGLGNSYMEYWLLSRMENHCVGYQHTEYNGRHYYIAYHS